MPESLDDAAVWREQYQLMREKRDRALELLKALRVDFEARGKVIELLQRHITLGILAQEARQDHLQSGIERANSILPIKEISEREEHIFALMDLTLQELKTLPPPALDALFKIEGK